MWIYSALGTALAVTLAITALVRSSRQPGAFDGDGYGMTRTVHRRYMWVGWLLALLCVISPLMPGLPTLAVVAVVVLVALLYFTSFLRGAESDE